jgi:hypothetical protein
MPLFATGCKSEQATPSEKPSTGTGAACPPGGTAPCPPAASPPNPGQESTTTGNAIDIVFDPNKSSKVTKCERIVHVQFIRIFVDGTEIKPGDYYSGYKYRDKVVASSGWWIDHLQTEKSPDYQQGTGDGKKNGGTSKAKISDAPNTGGGDKGFYNPVTNTGGWRKVNYKFETYAWCMKGPDCGKWYEGVQWEYTKTWEDQRDGKKGESTITDKQLAGPPSAGQIEAFDKFNKEKGFAPCK